MKFGVNLINFGPGATPEFLARTSRLAEALGSHFLMVSDHVATTPDVEAEYPAPFYDPFVTLAWIAASTRELELGTSVAVLPYRHPLQVASMSENIHRLSGGRFILGVGVGLARQEFEALGVPFEKRGAITDDYLEAIGALWSQDVASHDGEHENSALRCFWCNKANWMLIPSQMTRRTIFAALFSAHNHLQSVSNQLQVPQKEGLSPLANLEHQKSPWPKRS